MWRRPKPKSLGAYGEALAEKHLKRAGYKIIARNVRLGRKEIDLIALDGDTVVFIEVRTRGRAGAIAPEDTVNAVKQARIRSAAGRYVQANQLEDCYIRFDVVGVIVPEEGAPEIRVYRDAFS